MIHPHRPAALLVLALGLVALTLQSTPAAAVPAKFSDLSRQLEQQRQPPRLRGDAGRPTRKEPPVWPEQFHAVLLQNRGGALADVDLYYDHPNGRNLNIIKSRDDGSVLWDNERNNGSTYYYYPEKSPPECSVINFPVGILRPDWLSGAKYKGVEEYNGHQCDVWEQGSSYRSPNPFVTYYCDVETQEPVHWVFFDGGFFDVVEWVPRATLADEQWQLPAYCFDDDDDDKQEPQRQQQQRQRQRAEVATATD